MTGRVVANEDGIITYNLDVFPAYSYVIASSEQTKAFLPSEDYYGDHFSGAGINFHIRNQT